MVSGEEQAASANVPTSTAVTSHPLLMIVLRHRGCENGVGAGPL
jgi:hypothetical protein